MFDWLGDIIGGIGDAIGSVFSFLGEQISNVIFDTILQWFYTIIYNAVADFFTMMGNMGAEIFDLEWVDATVHLFTLFGWALFVAGVVVAIFDVAIEYQNGRANIKTTAINILKGFFACSADIGRPAKRRACRDQYQRPGRQFRCGNADDIWATEPVVYDRIRLLCD